ncbi:hypothetical protein Tco_1418143 [Tanacetum coccineum]
MLQNDWQRYDDDDDGGGWLSWDSSRREGVAAAVASVGWWRREWGRGSSAKKKEEWAITTTEDMQKRRNDVKARTTLLLALPDEHQLRFSKYDNAKELWEAILKTFGGNEATKKTKKIIAATIWQLKAEVQKKAGSNSQNMAFISSSNTSSGKGEVPTASVPTASSQVSTVSTELVLTKSKVEWLQCHKMSHLLRGAEAPRIPKTEEREKATGRILRWIAQTQGGMEHLKKFDAENTTMVMATNLNTMLTRHLCSRVSAKWREHDMATRELIKGTNFWLMHKIMADNIGSIDFTMFFEALDLKLLQDVVCRPYVTSIAPKNLLPKVKLFAIYQLSGGRITASGTSGGSDRNLQLIFKKAERSVQHRKRRWFLNVFLQNLHLSVELPWFGNAKTGEDMVREYMAERELQVRQFLVEWADLNQFRSLLGIILFGSGYKWAEAFTRIN